MIRGKSNPKRSTQSYSYRPNQSKPSRHLPWSIVAIAAISLAMNGLFVFKRGESSNAPRAEVRSELVHASKHFVILLDNTDPVSATQNSKGIYLAHQHIAEAVEGDQVTVFSLTSNPYDPLNLVFNETHPKSPSSASKWTNTPKLIDQRFKANFLEPFELALNAAMELKKQSKTPLIEAIYELAIDPRHSNQEIHFLIISDGLQHSDISAYRDNISIYRRSASSFLSQHSASMENFYVTFARIRRPGSAHRQGERHKKWIESYLYSNNTPPIDWSEL